VISGRKPRRQAPAAASAQARTFLEGEADRYFERNRAKYGGSEPHATIPALDAALDLIVDATRGERGSLRRALEVGCANGLLLDRLCSRLRCEGEGIDPSSAAIRDGSRRFPRLKMQVGTAEHLPFADAHFCVVLLGFFLYLVPDSHYLLAIAEANRVLRRGGFMIVVDFDHPHTNCRPYAHRPNVASYRHRALDVLTATRMYSLAAKWPVGSFALDPLERISLSLLYKEPDAYKLCVP
jgi:SAM-dependent methyltransferase